MLAAQIGPLNRNRQRWVTMPSRVCVIDIPGLGYELLAALPVNSSLGKWLNQQRVLGLTPSLPAVSASVQATITTGVVPARHGIISNGLPIFRFESDQNFIAGPNAEYRKEISFVEQSNQFVQTNRFWQDERGRARIKTALVFFHNCLPGSTGTPKPAADIALAPNLTAAGKRDSAITCLSDPPELASQLQHNLGPFPLENYCGPYAGIASSQWIAKAAIWVWQHYPIQLQFVAIPHLTFDLQRFGPNSSQAIKAVHDLAAAVDPLVDTVMGDHGTIVLLSDYSMRTVGRCVYPNRLLHDARLLITKQTPDGAMIDFDASGAVAMVDHQFAHVYTKSPFDEDKAFELLKNECRCWCQVQEGAYKMSWKSNRAGNFVLEAFGDAWFDYRWWTNPADAPSYASRVAPALKPGFDPLELFADAGGISQDASLIRGSHGVTSSEESVIAGPLGREKMLYLATDVAPELIRLLG